MRYQRCKPGRSNFLVTHFEKLESRRLLAADLALPAQIPGEILVQFVRDVNPAQQVAIRASVNAQLNSAVHSQVMKAAGAGELELLTVDPNLDINEAVKYLRSNPFVSFAEPNYVFQRTSISNDPYYVNGTQWGVLGDDLPTAVGPAGTSNPFGIQAEKVWAEDITGSSRIVVGILDEGIQVNHPDLVKNAWVNPYEIPDDGVDNDGNGYVDDIHGWDFVSDDNSVYDAGQDSHGTHVAGTIGAEGGNGLGVVGVNWDVSMISLKFLGPSGGTSYDAIRALDYLTDLKIRHGINIVASNNSWGGGGYSQGLHEAIIRSAKQEILFVTAAGNAGANNDLAAYYPADYDTTRATLQESAASYDSVIAVASITAGGALSRFSSYGATTVDLGAPGTGIWSTVPGDGYGISDGTSMATPHVTGAVALFAAAQGSRVSAATIKSAILQTATPTSSLAGKMVTGGRLNVHEAIKRSSFISLDREVYGIPGTIRVTVNSNAANLNSNLVETVSVSIRSTSESVAENVVLTETAANSGRFVGTIALASGIAVADGQLQAAHADEITASYSGLEQTATAGVDLVGPVISGLGVNVRATSGRISWTTDEAATTELVYGTSPDSLSQSHASTALLLGHKVNLTGLAPSTKYYFQARSRDAVGNLVTTPIEQFTTTTPAPILFVDDDLGAAYETYFVAALQANGYQYETWESKAKGRTPYAFELADYPTVIWTTGTNYSSPDAGLSPPEQTALAGYLNNGGRLYLSGQDVLYNGVTEDFRRKYLKVAAFVNDTIRTSHVATGVEGNLLSNGLSLPIAQPSDFATIYADEVLPTADAEGAFSHGRVGSTYGHSAVNYRGDYAAGGFGVVFTTFPFETISTTATNPNNAATFLRRTLDYLSAKAETRSILVSAPSPSAETTEQGGAVSFSVVLSAAPTANVTIPVTSGDPTEGTVSLPELIFTPENWHIPQAVTVSGVNDFVADGDVAFAIELAAASSSDASYHGLNPSDVQLVNLDDDSVGLIITRLTGASTSEAGGSVSFAVSLNSEPTAPVTFDLSSSDASEGLVSVANVVLGVADWNQPQTVTVSGVDDSLSDGHISYAIRFTNFTSLDPSYDGLVVSDLSLTNLDDESRSEVLFADSFEGPEWGGLWVEDIQNDWFISTQRATDGFRSAEVDGFANDATMTLNNLGKPIDTTRHENVTLTFAWLIETSFDSGEYVALDISTDGGLTWNQGVRQLRGNQSPEGIWLTEVVDLTPFTSTDFKIRFRSKVSDSTEDANVDDVRIVGRLPGPVNEPPIAFDDLYEVAEDQVLSVIAAGVLVNDQDPEGNQLIATLVGRPNHGTVVLDANGTFVYTPSRDFYGQDSFTYLANDGRWSSNFASVQISVTPVNDAPMVQDQPLTLVRLNTAKVLTLVATDVDNDPLSFAIVTPPLHGTLSGTGPDLTYTPHANFIGVDQFTFMASDGILDSGVASWALNVLPNNIPTAEPQSLQTLEDVLLQVELAGADADGDALSFIVVQPPSHGTLIGTVPNLTYVPHGDFNGADSFTFRSFDGSDMSAVATISLEVLPVNDAPVATAQSLSVRHGNTLPIELSGSDVDGDSLTYRIVTGPNHGTVTGTGASRTYVPAAGFFGTDNFSFRVNDGSLDSGLATVSIRVQAPAETILFADSFEGSEWSGKWVEDSQNDWFRSAQRSTRGSYSAEVDGLANNALLILNNNGVPIDTSAFTAVTLTYDWFIESSFDSGEYVTLDVSVNGGITWFQNIRGIQGNQSPENLWLSETVDLTPYSSTNLKIRFRSKVSDSAEDANLDNVKIVGIMSDAAGAGARMAASSLMAGPNPLVPSFGSVAASDDLGVRPTNGADAKTLAGEMALFSPRATVNFPAMDSYFQTLGEDEADDGIEWGPEDLSLELSSSELGSLAPDA